MPDLGGGALGTGVKNKRRRRRRPRPGRTDASSGGGYGRKPAGRYSRGRSDAASGGGYGRRPARTHAARPARPKTVLARNARKIVREGLRKVGRDPGTGRTPAETRRYKRVRAAQRATTDPAEFTDFLRENPRELALARASVRKKKPYLRGSSLVEVAMRDYVTGSTQGRYKLPKGANVKYSAWEDFKAFMVNESLRGTPSGSVEDTETQKLVKGVVRDPGKALGDLAKWNTEQSSPTNFQKSAGAQTKLVTAPVHIARATIEDPGKVAKNTLRSAKEILAGLPMGAAMLATDPVGVGKLAGKDLERRYGALLEGDTAGFREQVKKEGITPYVLDVAGVRGASPGSRAGVHAAAARSDRPAAQAITRATSPRRPALQVSAGEAGRTAQRTSRRLGTRLAQHGLDVARTRRSRQIRETAASDLRGPQGREQVRSGHGRLPAREAARGENAPVRTRDFDENTSLVPYFSLREKPGIRRFIGRTDRALGGLKSEERLRILERAGQLEREGGELLRKLSQKERAAFAYVYELGLTPQNISGSLRMLKRHRNLITRTRRKGEPEVERGTPDELPLLDEIIADPRSHITARAREAADSFRALEEEGARRDPGLTAEIAGARRVAPAAELRGQHRLGDVGEWEGRLQKLEDDINRGADAPGVQGLVDRYGGVGEIAPDHRHAVMREIRGQMGKQRRAAERRLRAAENEVTRIKGAIADRKATKTSPAAEGLEARLGRAETKVRSMRRGADMARREHEIAGALTQTLRRDKGRLEPSHVWETRVRRDLEEQALAAPGYFEHTGTSRLFYSLRTAGSGLRTPFIPKRNTGQLFRRGRRATDPNIIVEGLVRNTKRRFSWRLVTNTVRMVAFDWSLSGGRGMTVRQLKRELDRRGADIDDVEFVNVGKLERGERRAEAGVEDDIAFIDELDRDPEAIVNVGDQAEIHAGLQDAVESGTVRELIRRDIQPEELAAQPRQHYIAVPKADFEALAYGFRPSSGAGRAVELVLKSFPSRIILGAANIPWLGFQILSNGILSGLGGALNPFDVPGAMRWWKSLSREEKLAIEPELGITHGRHQIGVDRVRLASTVNNRFVNAGRALQKAMSDWRVPLTKGRVRGHDVNPINVMFRLDEAQNNAFRRTLFYSQQKRAAYKELGKRWDGATRATHDVTRLLPGELRTAAQVEKAMRDLIRNRPVFEKSAGKVREFLGDYVRYSEAERRYIARHVMFYGYLRFSLRLTFYTMPVHHPVMTAIIGELGKLGAAEAKEILGVPAEEDIPSAWLGNVYMKDGVLPFYRANPVMNALVQADRPTQVMGLFSPYWQLLADQMWHTSSFTGREWHLSGLLDMHPSDRPANYWSIANTAEQRAHVAAGGIARWFFPYRLLEDQGLGPVKPLEGPQTEDSTLWHRRGRTFKDPEIKRSIAERTKQRRQVRAETPLWRLVAPFASPTPSQIPTIAREEMEKRKKYRERKRHGGRTKPKTPYEKYKSQQASPISAYERWKQGQ